MNIPLCVVAGSLGSVNTRWRTGDVFVCVDNSGDIEGVALGDMAAAAATAWSEREPGGKDEGGLAHD